VDNESESERERYEVEEFNVHISNEFFEFGGGSNANPTARLWLRMGTSCF
jgi:hypothetical protein